jgi:DNA (cytosine-5)-methyltransferase 1
MDMGHNVEMLYANDIEELPLELNVAHNPIWDNAPPDAVAECADLSVATYSELPESDFMEIGYPCVAFSQLATAENRDLNHPHCGTLFIDVLHAIRHFNPAFIIFENVPGFASSMTLELIKRSMPGYNFSVQHIDGHDFGELESRKRVSITAVSDGLPDFDWSSMVPEKPEKPITVGDILDPVNPDDPAYREMAHVRARDNMKHLGYKNHLYYGHETKMVTLPASYGHPKAGTPMIAHPTNPDIQRQVSINEHAKLRQLPAEMHQALLDVQSGACDLVSARGSKQKGHRLLGNGVSPRPWHQKGLQVGAFLNMLKGFAPTAGLAELFKEPRQLSLS